MARGGSDQEIAEIKQRLALIEAHLEQLFTHLQVNPLRRPIGGYGDPTGEGDGWWGSSEDPATAGPSDKVLQLVKAGKKIEAVKAHHEETGQGLKESKDAIDALFEQHG